MNDELIENAIKFVADSLENSVEMKDIQLALAMDKEIIYDVYLIIIAGELLFKDRKNAPPKKYAFKESHENYI